MGPYFGTPGERSFEGSRVHGKNVQDAMHFAVAWIFNPEYCPDVSQHTSLPIQETCVKHASELIDAAVNYKTIWDFMILLQQKRKRATAERDPDGTIRFRYANQSRSDMCIADHFISAPTDPEQLSEIVSSGAGFNLDELLR